MELDTMEQFTAERCYDTAHKCLDDAHFIAIEREYAGIATLVYSALKSLETVGRICAINGQRRLEDRR